MRCCNNKGLNQSMFHVVKHTVVASGHSSLYKLKAAETWAVSRISGFIYLLAFGTFIALSFESGVNGTAGSQATLWPWPCSEQVGRRTNYKVIRCSCCLGNCLSISGNEEDFGSVQVDSRDDEICNYSNVLLGKSQLCVWKKSRAALIRCWHFSTEDTVAWSCATSSYNSRTSDLIFLSNWNYFCFQLMSSTPHVIQVSIPGNWPNYNHYYSCYHSNRIVVLHIYVTVCMEGMLNICVLLLRLVKYTHTPHVWLITVLSFCI